MELRQPIKPVVGDQESCSHYVETDQYLSLEDVVINKLEIEAEQYHAELQKAQDHASDAVIPEPKSHSGSFPSFSST